MPAPSRLPSPASVPLPWLAALAVVTFLSLGSYAGTQQVLRTGADDPQIQLAQDAAARLAAGAAPRDVVPAGTVDVGASLAPWLAVAGAGGVLAGNGLLHARAALPPAGVLAIAGRTGTDRVTWRPEPGARIALVAVGVPGLPGTVVLAGRSLREVESRIDRIGRLFVLAWAAATGAVLLAWLLTAWSHGSRREA